MQRRLSVLMLLVALGVTATPAAALDVVQRATVSGGRARVYFVGVPAGRLPGERLPVVVDLHGAFSPARNYLSYSPMGPLADAKRFLVVWPQGVNGFWNSGDDEAPTGRDTTVDDVAFIKSVARQVQVDFNGDARRTYCTGFSNGGFMTYKIAAADSGDVFAAYAPVSASMEVALDPARPPRPAPLLHQHGLADTVVPFQGGTVQMGPNMSSFITPVPVVIEQWRRVNRARLRPTVTTSTGAAGVVTTRTFRPASVGGAPLVLVTLSAGRHEYSAECGLRAWEFLSQFAIAP